jgi:hypothetical protein
MNFTHSPDEDADAAANPSPHADAKAWLRKVERLAANASALLGPGPVEIVQTHISVVLLGSECVLKFKKPVNLGFVDYSTLAKREAACEAELRLNRRLCPDVYVDIIPIREVAGEFSVKGDGPVVDVAVLMRRLPDDLMLDRLVADGKITEAQIDRIAQRLANFHTAAERGPAIAHFGSRQSIAANWRENFDQAVPYIGRTIERDAYANLEAWVSSWIGNNHTLIDHRVEAGFIRDIHGDVRCESICLGDDAYIFDCVEFSDRLRCCDVASEVAFLAMDLDARGRPDLGYFFTSCYSSYTGDTELLRLLPFYRCYRAFVRGKVLSFRIDEVEFGEDEKREAATMARRYFDLACRYATPLKECTVIAVAGLSGTGKSSLARAIAGELGLQVVASDELRHQLFPHPDHQSFTGHLWYRTAFDLTAAQAGDKVHLRFPGLFNEAWLYVNGNLVSYRKQNAMWWHNNYKFEWDVDLTGAIKPGENTIVLRTYNPHHFGGIFRRPFLYRPIG